MGVHRVRFEILRAIFFVLVLMWVIERYTELDGAGVLAMAGIGVLLLQIYEFTQFRDDDAG